MVASDEVLRQIAAQSSVPLWVPYPPPPGWLVTGVRWAGGDRTGPVATVVACSGPHPLPTSMWDAEQAIRTAELLLVAEEPGVGLGARLAGLPSVDPGGAIGIGAPALKLRADRHEVPLWLVEPGAEAGSGGGEPAGGAAGGDPAGRDPAGDALDTEWAELEGTLSGRLPNGPDATRLVGEAAGVWLWVLLWPADAAAVLMEPFHLVDHRNVDHGLVLAYGALSPRI